MGVLESSNSVFRSIMPASETWSWSGVLESPAGSEGGSEGGTELAESPAVSSGRAGADLVGSGAHIIGNRCSSSSVLVERSSRKYASILFLSSGFAAKINAASVIKPSFSRDGLSLHSAHCSGVGAAFAFGAPFGAAMSAGGGALNRGGSSCPGDHVSRTITKFQELTPLIPCIQVKGKDEGGHARGKSRCDQFSAVINLML